MPETIANEALANAVREVLETMFFTCVYAETPGGECAARIEARLPFSGGRTGEFRLGISPEAARTIAAGFLGAEDESQIGATQIGDVVCEVTNMVCGSLLSRLGADLAFDLQPPALAAPGAEDGGPACRLRTFDLGSGALTAGIRFDPS
jgi:CheY-specific phosphatase CheX